MGCIHCGKKTVGRGLCRTHYQRQWKAGLPALTADKRTSPLEKRFKEKISIDNNGCWKWTGAHADNGYGLIWKGSKNVAAHRESYRIFIGDVHESDIVCHKCDVRDCVNPGHLFIGDRGDNNRDMFQKRRHRFGARSHFAKLTEDDIRYILQNPEKSGTELGALFQVNQSTISRVRTGARWKTAIASAQLDEGSSKGI